METTRQKQVIERLALAAPTAGMLGALCEENYRLLTALVPAIAMLNGRYTLEADSGPVLVVEISRQGPWTQDVRMTHSFPTPEGGSESDPDAILRVYHDAHQTEVSQFEKQRILPLDGLYHVPGLKQKWQANLFLGRWLRYCISSCYKLSCLEGLESGGNLDSVIDAA